MPARNYPEDHLRIVTIGDTHGLHRELSLPPGEILLIAGDCTPLSQSIAAVRDFDDWLGELPYRGIFLTPGNHDWALKREGVSPALINNATVLIEEGCEFLGLCLWGSPVTPLRSHAFGEPSTERRLQLLAAIPEDTDVLITHIPPFGILDQVPGEEEHYGSVDLRDAVLRIRPKLHVFGHMHGANGIQSVDDTVFVNTALMGLAGELSYSPTALKLPRIRRSGRDIGSRRVIAPPRKNE